MRWHRFQWRRDRKEGGWVLLSNIHLVADWLQKLDKTLDSFSNVYTKMAQIAKAKAEVKAARRLARQVAKQGEMLAEEENKQQEGGDGAGADASNGEQQAGANNNNTEGGAAANNEEGGEGQQGEKKSAGEQQQQQVGATSASTTAPATTTTVAEGGEKPNDDDNKSQKSHDEERDGEEHEAEEEEEEDIEEEEDEGEFQDDDGLGKGSLNLRVFLSAEPSDVIPQGILQRCIKLTSEPPTGIAQNVNRALMNFSDDPWEKSAKPTEFRCITFAMCFFHAVIVERKKFGAQGWNRSYPFNVGDLTTCVDVLVNYIEDRPKVPWEDLRYVFGEIMYGGHITDDWDRTLCMAYLSKLVNPDVTDNLELCPGFPVPPPGNYQDYVNYVDQYCPPESPVLYGLHPNAEINYRTVQADVLFKSIAALQPKKSVKRKKGVSAAAAAAAEEEAKKKESMDGPSSPEDIVKAKLDELVDKSPEQINMLDIVERLDEDRTPPQHVFFQEIERINKLLAEMKRALQELDLGLKGALSMSSDMQLLFDELFMDKIPTTFSRYSFESMRSLSGWHDSLNARYQQLQDWTGELQTPKVTMLNLFFNPMSFLTAIMQSTSMANNYDLDQMSFVVDVTKKAPDQIDIPARDGAYIYGLSMEGARWDTSLNSIDDSRMKELYPRMPVIHIKALPSAKVDRRDQYECPVYKTQGRGHTIVVGLFFKTKQPARKWIIAGVGAILDVVE